MRRTRTLIIAVVLIALLVRVAVLVATPDYEPRFDAGDYDRHAIAISETGAYPETVLAPGGGPSMFRPPAYPYVLGGVYAIAGEESGPQAGRVLGVILGVGAVVITFLLGRAIWGERVGLLAAGIVALAPPFVFQAAALATEPLFLLFEIGVLFAVVRARQHDLDLRLAAVAGVLCGLAALTRSNGILLVLPAMVGVLSLTPLHWRSFLPPVVVGVAALLTVTPWLVRNAIVFDEPVGLSTQAGFAIAGAYSEDSESRGGARSVWVLPETTERYAPLYASDLSEIELDSEFRDGGMDYAWEHPGFVVQTTLLNSLRIVHILDLPPLLKEPEKEQLGLGHRGYTLVRIGFLALGALAFLGILTWRRQERRVHVGWWFWAVGPLMILAAAPLIGSTRYGVPLLPLMALLGSAGAVAAWNRLSRRKQAGDSLEVAE